jgi:hypothetical protein
MWFIKNRDLILEKKICIGIVATSSAVGLTHTAILLYTYLSSFLKRKTAYIEMKDIGGFNTEKQNFFLNLSIAEIAYLKEKGYNYIIIDYGKLDSKNREDFLRCDIRIIMTSLSEWKINNFINLLEMEDKRILDSYVFLHAFGEDKIKRKIERRYKIDIVKILYSQSPFVVTQENYKVLTSLVQRLSLF